MIFVRRSVTEQMELRKENTVLSEEQKQAIRQNPLWRCSCGKSMIDCRPKEVEETFRIVAQAEENVRTGNTSYKTSHPPFCDCWFCFPSKYN